MTRLICFLPMNLLHLFLIHNYTLVCIVEIKDKRFELGIQRREEICISKLKKLVDAMKCCIIIGIIERD